MEKDPRMYAHGPYRYITMHGIGPGTLPKDVKLVKWEDLDNFYTAIWTDRFLTTKELQQYDIYPESVQSIDDIPKLRKSVMESLTNEEVDELGAQLAGLNAEQISWIVSLFEYVNDEYKSNVLDVINTLFAGKKLVPIEDEVSESVNNVNKAKKVSESYTRRLLGDI